MNTSEYAQKELALLLADTDADDDIQQEFYEGILEIIALHSSQGHSLLSASLAVDILSKLLKFEPLTPLTGKEKEWEEWTDVKDGSDPYKLRQNLRCPRVFQREDLTAFDVEGAVFCKEGKDCYTNSNSHVNIDFPYVPQTQIINIT